MKSACKKRDRERGGWIHAEGFDITDVSVQPRACLTAETAIDGSRMLTLRFRYGSMEYMPESKAIARAHRIGQHRSVFVYRFVSAGTLEEQILTLQDRKQSLIDSVMPFICKST